MLDGADSSESVPPPAEVDPAVLPDPTDGFDSNSARLVDIETFTTDANNLEEEGLCFSLPTGSTTGMYDTDKQALIAKIYQERDTLLKPLTDQIAVIQKVQVNFTAIQGFLTDALNDNRAELATLGNDIDGITRRNLLTVAITNETSALNLCKSINNTLTNQLTFLNDYSSKLIDTFDRIIENIKVLDFAVDSSGAFIPYYYTDSESIV